MDKIRQVLEYSCSVNATPRQMLEATRLREQGVPTLAEDVAAMTANDAVDTAVLGSYPSGVRRILDGEPARNGLGPVPAFGQHSRFEFTATAASAHARQLQGIVAADQLATAQHFANSDPNAHGWGAADAYVDACRAVGRLLVAADLLAEKPDAAPEAPQAWSRGRSPAKDAGAAAAA